MNNWQLPDDYVKQYLEACKEAATNDEAFKVFRRHPIIKTVIENSTEEYLEKSFEELRFSPILNWLSKFYDSEDVGDPIKENDISPTTMRYIYIVHLINKLIGTLDDFTIVEIGGGYGGQCKIIHDVYKPYSYAIHDLPEPQMLQNRFLKEFGITQLFRQTFKSDLLIAWCSWSELNLEARKEYLPLIAKARHIFICSNYNFAEDLELIKSVHPDAKVYSDHLYQNIIYT